MKNIRYYYDCPTEAAYMAKHFGMKLLYERGDNKPSQPLPLWAIARRIECDDNAARYYIHPDSLHILVPQAGNINTERFIFSPPYWQWVEGDSFYNVSRQHHAKDEVIILPGQKPFFWPKQEEV